MSGIDPFVIMAKPVGSRCNMRCRYCYYLSKGQYSTHGTQTVMETDLLEKIIRETVEACPGPTVSFVWHGGEPTLAGIPFYRKALQLERRYVRPGQEVWNNLQTNGVLIDDEWAAFLARHHFDVGVSLDGSEAVHDENRRDLGGGPTWEKAVRAVKTLKKHGINPDLLCTVNAASVRDPLTVYRALRDLRTGWMQFIPILVVEGKENGEVRLSKESVTSEDYGRFLISVFDEWIANDLGNTDVQFFAEMAEVLAGRKASLCWMAETCGRVFIAEEDGAVYACDHFVDDEHRLGYVSERPLTELTEKEEQKAFGNGKRDRLTAECRACPYLRFCNGACPKDRYGKSTDGEPGQYYLCAGLKAFFRHAVPRMERAMELIRNGMEIEKVRRRMRTWEE